SGRSGRRGRTVVAGRPLAGDRLPGNRPLGGLPWRARLLRGLLPRRYPGRGVAGVGGGVRCGIRPAAARVGTVRLTRPAPGVRALVVRVHSAPSHGLVPSPPPSGGRSAARPGGRATRSLIYCGPQRSRGLPQEPVASLVSLGFPWASSGSYEFPASSGPLWIALLRIARNGTQLRPSEPSPCGRSVPWP